MTGMEISVELILPNPINHQIYFSYHSITMYKILVCVDIINYALCVILLLLCVSEPFWTFSLE